MTLTHVIHITLAVGLLTPLSIIPILATKAIWQKPINEHLVSRLTQFVFMLYLLCTITTFVAWSLKGFTPFKWDLGVLYQTGDELVPFSLYLDAAGIVFLLIIAVMANTIVFFSRRYLHRDPGYRRFFFVLSLFVFGLTLFTCAGSFDFLFLGWEIVGLSSFLLIGFYWHRRGAAINANRAYFIYRITDVGLLAGALISHTLWHSPDLFFDLSHNSLLLSWGHTPLWQQWLLSTLILLPVIGKSAQFPLCFWLPKAMEGPTPSSAIFYGSLSIHAGVFLLIRTFWIWSHTPGFVWLLGSLGLITAIFATLCSRVQANIKGQIGYASIAQVGLMLVELALGFPNFALAHLTGNAFLRCFQLLVSSSIITQQLQIHSALEGKKLRSQIPFIHLIPQSIQQSIFIWSINEGYIEAFIHRYLVFPLMRLAQIINPVSKRLPLLACTVSFAVVHYFIQDLAWLPYGFLTLALVLCFTSLGETKQALTALHSATFSNLIAVVALLIHHPRYEEPAILYLVGLCASWMLATDSLLAISRQRTIFPLTEFSGLFGQFPVASTLNLIGILGIIGFPIASTFFGEDLLIQHSLENGWIFLAVFTLTFVLNGISLIRMYSHVFWGRRDNDIPELRLDYSGQQALARVLLFAAGNCLAFAL